MAIEENAKRTVKGRHCAVCPASTTFLRICALVEQHCSTLIGLTKAMQHARKSSEDVHSLITALISTYEADLVRVMKDRK